MAREIDRYELSHTFLLYGFLLAILHPGEMYCRVAVVLPVGNQDG